MSAAPASHGSTRARELPSQLVDAAAVARYLDVDRGWVYEHADELRARRLGTGPKARFRFSLEDIEDALTCSTSRGPEESPSRTVEPNRRRRRRTPMGTNVHLLPIRARNPLQEAS